MTKSIIFCRRISLSPIATITPSYSFRRSNNVLVLPTTGQCLRRLIAGHWSSNISTWFHPHISAVSATTFACPPAPKIAIFLEELVPPVNFDIVTSPLALIPSRAKTFFTVRMIILRSSQNEWLSTYQTSYSNFWSQLMALRPLTCAHPVIPGLTKWRRDCTGLYRGRYSTRRGLGPTKLISPFNTFTRPGNSSKLLDRKKVPKDVMRSESGREFPF